MKRNAMPLLMPALLIFCLADCTNKPTQQENIAPEKTSSIEESIQTPAPTPTAAEFFTAAYNNNRKALRRMIAAGADVNAKNEYGFAPLHGAAGNGSAEVVRMLIEAGADVNITTGEGDTPLHYAVDKYALIYEGQPAEVVRLLLAAGAAPNARNNRNETPLGYGGGRVDHSTEAALLLRAAGGRR